MFRGTAGRPARLPPAPPGCGPGLRPWDSVDVLFVDEAAQVSLANVLAVSHAGPSLVLLGDPQQLDQPTQGTHPDGTEVSALGPSAGRASDHRVWIRGCSWRRPGGSIQRSATFTSETFYEGKLASRPGP